MAYVSQDFKSDKGKHVHGYCSCAPALQTMDASLVAGGGGYSAPTWPNGKLTGSLGPHVLSRLQQMSDALANAGAHYVHVRLTNDKLGGGIGPELIAKLNAMGVEIQNLRP